jgi:tetratricopeptide (TPR) repeat protein
MRRFGLLESFVIVAAALSFSACSRTAATNSVPESPVTSRTLPANDAVRQLELRIKRDPEDFVALNKLAAEYLKRLRETGDASYLDLASRTARASLAVLPAEQNKGGLTVLTQAEFSSHDFRAAREHAEKLIEFEPTKSYPYQHLGDAQLELGNYTEAENAFRAMSRHGSLQGITVVATEQRLARLRMLRGDTKGAVTHFSNALKIAQRLPVPPAETIAWCQWQLGETAFSEGDYKKAEEYYNSALVTLPNYFRAVASLGKVKAATGDLAGAIEQYERVVRVLPDPIFVSALGDLYAVSGRAEDARKQFDLVEKIGSLSELNGAIYNRGLALFYADHDLKPDEAYALAAKEYEVRRDIYGADAVAWTALKAGKLSDAQAAARDALKLGTRDAKIFYHAGVIEERLGRKAEARRLIGNALKLNPSFDPVQAPIARKLLDELNR